MSEVISSNADINRLAEYLLRTYRNAVARVGMIADAANVRLKPALADIDAEAAILRVAEAAEAEAWAAVVAEDALSDVLIGATRDAMWAALGRPGHNRHLAEAFPGGIGAYTKGNPRRQPVLMGLLESRILSCAAPRLSQEQRTAWAAAIAAARKSYEEALTKHSPAEAAAFIARATYRSAVKMGHESLRAFKRDLQTLGLSKTQIFEIIPDGTPGASAASKANPPTQPGTPAVPGTTPADTRRTRRPLDQALTE